MTIRTINLEEGMPTVKEARLILEQELSRAKNAKVKVVKFIHGYGSSGTGGKIRTSLIKVLSEMKTKKQIKDYILGDKWSIFDESSRSIIDTCPQLSKDSDLERYNIGITLVLL